jgi:transcriptional regulator with PAS, ATPase and Fis domain
VIVRRVLERLELSVQTERDDIDLTLEELERKHVERVLRIEGSVEAAAVRLGISRSALYVRLKRYRS